MSLQKYKNKRDFSVTPEPDGKPKSGKEKVLRFVVQKHHASHLHYDFRLQVNDVLKSWAVPKGPSLDPEDKRLAIMVEDHPLEYIDFEGIIPEGNYGAGTVIVWDTGKYEPIIDEKLKNNSIDNEIEKKLKKGHLDFILHGEKLKGNYSLVRIGNDEKKWLLIKKKTNSLKMPTS